jgi:predicted SAM-dependent methyltransferase
MDLRLNIGAGSTHLEGFTPWDRRTGAEAFPLPFKDGEVSEIYASHVLEHLSFADAIKALAEWQRVLKPGGRLRVAVPDFGKIASPEFANDPMRRFYLMGGQTDANDFHRSAWTDSDLRGYLSSVGFEVEDGHWQSSIQDCAALPVSLNIAAIKPDATPMRICALINVPRWGYQDHFLCVYRALAPLGIELLHRTGVFWDKCMQTLIEEAKKRGFDWVLSLDMDTIFDSGNVSEMLRCFAENPHIDALAAMQAQRGSGRFLAGLAGATEASPEMTVCATDPMLVTTAHFGFTLFRVEAFDRVPKPWIIHQPDENGTYSGKYKDADINFWHKWGAAGNNIAVLPSCVVGQLEEVCIWSQLDGTVRRAQTSEFLAMTPRERAGLAA